MILQPLLRREIVLVELAVVPVGDVLGNDVQEKQQLAGDVPAVAADILERGGIGPVAL